MQPLYSNHYACISPSPSLVSRSFRCVIQFSPLVFAEQGSAPRPPRLAWLGFALVENSRLSSCLSFRSRAAPLGHLPRSDSGKLERAIVSFLTTPARGAHGRVRSTAFGLYVHTLAPSTSESRGIASGLGRGAHTREHCSPFRSWLSGQSPVWL